LAVRNHDAVAYIIVTDRVRERQRRELAKAVLGVLVVVKEELGL
jgi:hypothetical protein